MEDQKLVLQEGTYEYDDLTKQVSVSEEDLRKAGYVKLADDEQIVKKVELSEEEAEFVKRNNELSFCESRGDFRERAACYADIHSKRAGSEFAPIFGRLVRAYFTGYTVRETKYYIGLAVSVPTNTTGCCYLNVDQLNKSWHFYPDKFCRPNFKNQFTKAEIDELQKSKYARGLDLNMLKAKVPYDGKMQN